MDVRQSVGQRRSASRARAQRSRGAALVGCRHELRGERHRRRLAPGERDRRLTPGRAGTRSCWSGSWPARGSATTWPASLIRPIGVGGSHLELVVTGLVRAEVSSPDGRSLAIRYARPGGLLGDGVAVRRAVHDARLAPRARRLGAAGAPAGGRPAGRPRGAGRGDSRSSTSSATASSRSSRRSRAARSRRSASGSPGTCSASPARRRAARRASPGSRQQQLADAVGTVREVVVRELRGPFARSGSSKPDRARSRF